MALNSHVFLSRARELVFGLVKCEFWTVAYNVCPSPLGALCALSSWEGHPTALPCQPQPGTSVHTGKLSYSSLVCSLFIHLKWTCRSHWVSSASLHSALPRSVFILRTQNAQTGIFHFMGCAVPHLISKLFSFCLCPQRDRFSCFGLVTTLGT